MSRGWAGELFFNASDCLLDCLGSGLLGLLSWDIGMTLLVVALEEVLDLLPGKLCIRAAICC